MKNIFILLIALSIVSCKTDIQPKPKAFLSLKYQNTGYTSLPDSVPYQFDISKDAVFKLQHNLWSDVNYPALKASINITYYPIQNNLEKLISDAEKRTFKHTVKADNIEVYPFDNPSKNVYARLFEVSGNAASTIQFQATDSTDHFLTGALYFDALPNYDSILPAKEFLKKDIQRIIESLEWKKK